jgi:hypothetical protein
MSFPVIPALSDRQSWAAPRFAQVALQPGAMAGSALRGIDSLALHDQVLVQRIDKGLCGPILALRKQQDHSAAAITAATLYTTLLKHYSS